MHNFSPPYLIPPPSQKKKEEINKDYNRLIYRTKASIKMGVPYFVILQPSTYWGT